MQRAVQYMKILPPGARPGMKGSYPMMVRVSDALGRSCRVSDGVQDPSQVTVIVPGFSGLVQRAEKGYLAAPGGAVRNRGAVVMVGFEQVTGIVGSAGVGVVPNLVQFPNETI